MRQFHLAGARSSLPMEPQRHPSDMSCIDPLPYRHACVVEREVRANSISAHHSILMS
jgi:hypothetical protein